MDVAGLDAAASIPSNHAARGIACVCLGQFQGPFQSPPVQSELYVYMRASE